MRRNKHRFHLQQPPPICSSITMHPSLGLMVGRCCQRCLCTLAEQSTSSAPPPPPTTTIPPPPPTTRKFDTRNEADFSGDGPGVRAPPRAVRACGNSRGESAHAHATTSRDERVAKRFLLVIFSSCTTDPLVELPPSHNAFTVKMRAGTS